MAEYNPSKIIKDGNTYNFRDTTKIPLAGSNEISGSLIPNTDGTVNLGSPSYQWNNAYIKSLTINGVVCGDILTHNVSEFVNVTGAQTIGGVKTFSSNVIIQGSKKVTCNLDNSFIELDGGTTWGKGGSIVLSGQDRSSYTNSVLIVSKSDTNTDILQYQNGELKPLSNNTNNSSLGTSTNKWKTFNGLNPGALSLPSSSSINVDTTDWDLTCQNGLMGSFTPTADGWLMLHVANSGTSEVNFWIIGGVIRINNKSTPNIPAGNNFNMITIPVEKDKTYNIYGNASEYVAGRSIAYCRFMPCQGNV